MTVLPPPNPQARNGLQEFFNKCGPLLSEDIFLTIFYGHYFRHYYIFLGAADSIMAGLPILVICMQI